ncbi:MAG: TolB family protein, partial [Candidatus Dojkabacteria bacterium]
DYEIIISQGENEVFGFKMVEIGTATYLGLDPLKVTHFFKADLDGTNPTQIETILKFNPKNEYYDSRDGLQYFLSQHDVVKGLTKTVDIAYSLNPETKEVKRLTTSNFQNFDVVSVNFRAKRLINNYQSGPSNQKQRFLQILDLSGDNPKTLRTVTGDNNFDNIVVSGDGRYVYFREGDLSSKPTDNPIVYRADSQSDNIVKVVQRKSVQVHAVSEDGNLVVYSAQNESTGLRDLFLFNASTSETRTIKENHDGSQYQFLNQNNDQIIFFAKRDSKNDIYDYSISQNSTTRITNLAGDDVLNSLYQQEKYTFYITKRGLFVIDILKPHSFKLVTDKITKYTN